MKIENQMTPDPAYMGILAHRADEAREKIKRFEQSENVADKCWAKLASEFTKENIGDLTPKQIKAIREAQLSGLDLYLIEDAIKTAREFVQVTTEYRKLYPLCPWD